jgi:hypothetical protein
MIVRAAPGAEAGGCQTGSKAAMVGEPFERVADADAIDPPRPKLERVVPQDRCQAALEADQRRGEMRSYEPPGGPRSTGAGPHQSIGMKSP